MPNTHLADFHGFPIEIVDHNGQQWITAEQAGIALGYTQHNARKGISKLFNRHAEEFDQDDTCVVKLGDAGQRRDYRAFSASGCALLSMFSNTDRAKQFRVWAKKTLTQPQQSEIVGLEVPTYIRRELLAARPLWQKIYRYKQSGLNHAEIGKLVDRNVSTVREHVRRMEKCGLLEAPNNLLALQHMAREHLGAGQ